MCDPLSATASVIAVAGVAAQTCEYLYKTVRCLSDAPKEVRRHVVALQALQSTLTGIAALEKDIPNPAIFTEEFKKGLRECISDLQAIEQHAKPFQQQFDEGTARRTWAKVRWSSVDHKYRIKKYLARIESHYAILSLGLSLLHIRLSLYPKDVPQVSQRVCTDQTDDVMVKGASTFDSRGGMQTRLENFEQDVSLRSSFFTSIERETWHFTSWFGPISAERRPLEQSFSRKSLSSKGGCGFAFATTSYAYCAWRLEFAMFLVKKRSVSSMSFCIHWNLSFPSIIPGDAHSFILASAGDISGLQELFSTRAANPYDVRPDGSTLLHLAVSGSNYDMVQFLLQEGAKVNSMENSGETPLHWALAFSKDYNIPRLLIEHGADLQNRNADAQTPLHTFFNQVVEQVLYSHADLLDLSACDRSGMTLLHYLAWSSKTSVKTFTSCYARCNLSLTAHDAQGRSLLHLAAQRGNVSLIEHLLNIENRFDLNQPDCTGRTVLHYAVESKRGPETIKALAPYGPDFCAVDRSGRSAMHHAAQFDRLSTLKTLLAHGMAEELGVADCLGFTPVQIAEAHGADAVRDFLLREDAVLNHGQQLNDPCLEDQEASSRVETDHSLRAPLSTLQRETSSASPLQIPPWTRKSRTTPPQTFGDPGKSSRYVDDPYRLVKIFALTVGMWMFLVFVATMRYPNVGLGHVE